MSNTLNTPVEALELAARIPALRMGGAVEVRPVLMAMTR